LIAHECGVAYDFQPVFDLMSQSRADWGDNPALKLPVLETGEGKWFGALNISRELARHAPKPVRVLWPEDLRDRTAANAQELVITAMSTVVSLVMRGLPASGANPVDDKARVSLTQTLDWLEAQLPAAVGGLPERTFSFLEASSIAFIRHLEFRKVLDMAPYPALRAFAESYSPRASVRDTEYKFD
jgi:glutathione S-transferase